MNRGRRSSSGRRRSSRSKKKAIISPRLKNRIAVSVEEWVEPFPFSLLDFDRKVVLLILNFVPHSKVLRSACCNRAMRDLVANDFPLFRNYTLTFNCGRRSSFVKSPRGSLLHAQRGKRSSPREVAIHDRSRSIHITTNNRPLRSERVRKALHRLCRSHVSRLHLKRLLVTRIPTNVLSVAEQQSLSRMSSAANTPAVLHKAVSSPLVEAVDEGQDEESYSRSDSSGDEISPFAMAAENLPLATTRLSRSFSHPKESDLPGFTPRDSKLFRKRRSKSGDSILRDLRKARLSTSQFGSNDEAFVIIIQMLVKAHIESLIIGEECGQWTWSVLVYVLRNLRELRELKVCTSGFAESLPSIARRKDYFNFVKSFCGIMPSLESLWVYDDSLLRILLQLSRHREKSHPHHNHTRAANDGRGRGMMRRRADREGRDWEEVAEEEEEEREEDGSPSHLVRPRGIECRPSVKRRMMERLNHPEEIKRREEEESENALNYVRYQCQFSPLSIITGVAFEGVAVLEVVPWDGMFLNVPRTVRSLRLGRAPNFTEKADWTILLPAVNVVEELCLHQIKNVANIRGLSTLTGLRWFVVKQRPKSAKHVIDSVFVLSSASPLAVVSLLFVSKKEKQSKDFRSLQRISVHRIKEEFEQLDHPMFVQVFAEYQRPPFCTDSVCRFSDFC